jgi:hypothetical protein
MKIRNLSYCLTLLMTVLIPQLPAYSVPTKWENVNVSMSDLLNSGWQITAHGVTRVAASSSAGAGFDEFITTFILAKGGKYIFCISENPRPPVANQSSCRRLN